MHIVLMMSSPGLAQKRIYIVLCYVRLLRSNLDK